MKYIISEELKNEIRYILDKSDKHEIVYKIDDLQPVELVAEGRMIVDEDNKPKIYTFRENDHWAKPGTQMGSLYKIYSQKVKE